MQTDDDKLVERLRVLAGDAFPHEQKTAREEACAKAADRIEALKQHAPDALLREARDALSKAKPGHSVGCAVNDPGNYIGGCTCGAKQKWAATDALIARIDAALRARKDET